MRIVFALTLFAGALLIAPGSASSAPPIPGDHAAIMSELSGAAEEVARRDAKSRRHVRKYKRRYDWTSRPYWRPFQYRYWRYYYPYGGPLF
jgi:hypothetical protein